LIFLRKAKKPFLTLILTKWITTTWSTQTSRS
jgi:hypothetical protein